MMKYKLNARKILEKADYKEIGLRRWDFMKGASLFYSTWDDWYEGGPMLWKNSWAIHMFWGDCYTSIKVSRKNALDILTQSYGEQR